MDERVAEVWLHDSGERVEVWLRDSAGHSIMVRIGGDDYEPRDVYLTPIEARIIGGALIDASKTKIRRTQWGARN